MRQKFFEKSFGNTYSISFCTGVCFNLTTIHTDKNQYIFIRIAFRHLDEFHLNVNKGALRWWMGARLSGDGSTNVVSLTGDTGRTNLSCQGMYPRGKPFFVDSRGHSLLGNMGRPMLEMNEMRQDRLRANRANIQMMPHTS